MKVPVIKLRMIKYIALNVPLYEQKNAMYWCKVQGTGLSKAWIASTCVICAKRSYPDNICSACADNHTIKEYILANKLFGTLMRAGNYTTEEAATIVRLIIAHDEDEASSNNNLPILHN